MIIYIIICNAFMKEFLLKLEIIKIENEKLSLLIQI